MVAGVGMEERVRIVAEIVTKGLNKLGQVSKGINTAQRSINKNVQGFGKTIAQPLQSWRQFNKEGKTFQTRGGRLANSLRMATHGMRGFRMEMLGVMFFGMNMQRMFMGFIKPVMEVYGVFELFGQMLLLTFIPTMDDLLDPFLKFFEYMTALPEATQKAIGSFTVLMIILSTLLMYFGVLSLGIGSIIQTLPTLLGAFRGVFSGISKLVGGLSVFFAILTVVVIGFVLAWKENFGEIKEWTQVLWNGIKDIFGGVFQVIGGIVKAFISILKGDFKGFSSAVKSIFTGIWRIITGIFKTISGFIVVLSLSVFRVVTGIYTFIYKAWEKVFEVTKVVWQKVKDFVLSVLYSFIGGISSLIDKLARLFKLRERDGGGGGGGGGVDDFIWRPGSAPVSVNPNDTIVGAKSGLGGVGTTVNLSVSYNINVSDKTEFERMMDDNNKNLVDDVKRMIGA